MKEKLHPYHIAFLTYMIQNGIVIFRLPSLTAASFGTNGWLAILPIAGVVTFHIFLMSLVNRIGKGRSLFEIMERSISRMLLYPFYLGLAFLWAMVGCLVAKQYILIYQMISFPTTSPMLFKLAVDIIIYLLLIKGIYNIAKSATVFFWCNIWMIGLFPYFMQDFEWVRLSPFLFQGGSNWIKGIIDTYTAFLGYELALLFIPYASSENRWFWAVHTGNFLITAVYVLVCLISFGFFSTEQLKQLQYPLLDLLAFIKFPFIERIENMLYVLFLMSIIITSVMYIWSAKEALMRIFKKTKQTTLSFWVIAIPYGISFIPDVIDEVQQWLGFTLKMQIIVSFALTLLALVLLFLQRRGGESHG